MPNQTGVLLVGHGTRSPTGIRQFLDIAKRAAKALAPVVVEPAFLEISQPDIDAAIGRLATRGIERLVTLPLLLFAAGHAKRDIPDQVSTALARRGLSQIEHLQASHLGCHPALVQLSDERMRQVENPKSTVQSQSLASACKVQACLVPTLQPGNARTGGSRPPINTRLLLVGRGSHDESATAEMHQFAALRQQSLDDADVMVDVAFLAMARPLLADQLPRVAQHDCRRVIIQPHLLFHGELVEAVERQVAAVATEHSDKEWIVTPPLADLPGIVTGLPGTVTSAAELIQKVILARLREAGFVLSH